MSLSVQDLEKKDKELRDRLQRGEISQTLFDKQQAQLVGLAETAGGAKNAPALVKQKFAQAVAEKGLEKKFGETTEKGASSFKVDGKNAGAIASAGLKLAGIGGEGETDTMGGAAGGAASAMSTAASFGLVDPVSQGTAAVIGGAMGAMGARGERKAQERAAESRAQAQLAQDLGRAEEEKDRKIQGALAGMRSAFSSSFQSVGKRKVKI